MKNGYRIAIASAALTAGLAFAGASRANAQVSFRGSFPLPHGRISIGIGDPAFRVGSYAPRGYRVYSRSGYGYGFAYRDRWIPVRRYGSQWLVCESPYGVGNAYADDYYGDNYYGDDAYVAPSYSPDIYVGRPYTNRIYVDRGFGSRGFSRRDFDRRDFRDGRRFDRNDGRNDRRNDGRNDRRDDRRNDGRSDRNHDRRDGRDGRGDWRH